MHILLSVTYWGWMLLTMAEPMKRLYIRDEWFLTLNLFLSTTAKSVHQASKLISHFPHFLIFLLLVFHYLLRSWVHLGFTTSWGQTSQALLILRSWIFIRVWKIPLQFYNRAVIKNRNGNIKAQLRETISRTWGPKTNVSPHKVCFLPTLCYGRSWSIVGLYQLGHFCLWVTENFKCPPLPPYNCKVQG